MNNVKIFKQYKLHGDKFEINMPQAIDNLEIDGYYKKGTIQEIIESGGGVLQTPAALFTIVVK